MMKKQAIQIVTLCLSFLFITLITNAQIVRVTGTIKDENNSAIEGATIAVKSSNRAVITDNQGNFSINANAGDVLILSLIHI